MNRSTFFVLISCCIAQVAIAQSNTHPSWVDLTQNRAITFESLKQQHDSVWTVRPTERGQGFKQMERYFALYNSRLNSQGIPYSGEEIIRQWEEVRGYSAQRSLSGNWQPLGPILDANTTRDHIEGVGRTSCTAFHPTDPNILLCGTPAGGIWKSNDGGNWWTSNTDWLPTLGVSALLFDPTNPQIIYAGTGDRDASDSPGMGVLKSTDGGETWEFMNAGIESYFINTLRYQNSTGWIWACTNEGIFYSPDQGLTWVQSSSNTINYKDMEFHPTNDQTIYATGGGRLYISYDGGVEWDYIMQVLGTGARMCVDVSPAAPDNVYVLKTGTTEFSGFYLSTDAGQTFVEQSDSPNIMGWAADGSSSGGQAWYDLCLSVDPLDAQVVYVGGIRMKKSVDAGVTWVDINPNFLHVDQHESQFSPVTHELYLNNDGGIYRYANHNEWIDISHGIINGQIYQLGQSINSPNNTLTGFQDNGTAEFNGLLWKRRGGGDGFECAYDHLNDITRYGSIYYGDIYRTNANVVNQKICGIDVLNINESGAWNTPYLLDRTDTTGNTMFVGLKNVWRSTNIKVNALDEMVWVRISNNLGGNNTTDINEMEHCSANPNIFYASEGSRKLFRTSDVYSENPTWVNLSNDLPVFNAPVNAIETNPLDSNVVYICFETNVYKSMDRGETWENLTSNLPDVTMNCMVLDTTDSGIEALYVGSDMGVWYKDSTMTDWLPFNEGMPLSARVTELEIYYSPSAGQHRLKASTYGRGLWESDLYSTSIQVFPPVCAIEQLMNTVEVYGNFEVSVRFANGLSDTDMSDFDDLNDLDVINATVNTITGGPSNYVVNLTPSAFGPIHIVVPASVALTIDNNLGNLPSDTLRLISLPAPALLGPDGPGGVGDASSLHLWLRADVNTTTNMGNVSIWGDVYGNGNVALENENNRMPALMLDENGIGGRTAIAFDGDDDRLVAEDIPSGRSMSAYCIAECPEISFNEHGWFASARMPNGYLLHPWKNEEQFHAEVLDNNEGYSGTNTFYIGDASAPHMYGLLYEQDDIYQTMQTLFDDHIQYLPGVNIGERIDNALININIGRDFGDRYGEGMIGEEILYGERLMPVANRIVTNYLASRYGIDLGPLSLYHHPEQPLEVIGIGMEGPHDRHLEARGLSQIHLSNAQSLTNGDYLLIGQDDDSFNMTNNAYPFLSERIEKTFGFTETGDCGTITISLSASLFNQTEGLGIIYTADDQFSINSALVFVPLVLDGNDLTASFDLPNEGIFTIGYAPELTVDPLLQAKMNLYPNPADHTIQLNLVDCEPEHALWMLLDASGRLVAQGALQRGVNTLSVEQLPAGVYHLRANLDGKQVLQSKVVIY
jgi:hypothetical protein